VSVYLRHKPKLKKLAFDVDFSELAIKGRAAGGNMVTKHAIRKIVLKDQGVSTLSAMDIWFDDAVLRLNADKRGQRLGAFKGDDKILAVYASGHYRIMGFDLSTHFEEKPLVLEKLKEDHVVTAVYIDGETGYHYLKRFGIEQNGKPAGFIGDHKDSRLLMVTTAKKPRLLLRLAATARKEESEETVDAEQFIAVKSHKARGKRLTTGEVLERLWVHLEPEGTEPEETKPEKTEPEETGPGTAEIKEVEKEEVRIEDTGIETTDIETIPTAVIEKKATGLKKEEPGKAQRVLSKPRQAKKGKAAMREADSGMEEPEADQGSEATTLFEIDPGDSGGHEYTIEWNISGSAKDESAAGDDDEPVDPNQAKGKKRKPEPEKQQPGKKKPTTADKQKQIRLDLDI